MASFNRAILIGNLTRDPELRYIPSGQAVATFTVAMNRVYTLNGERKEDVSFVRVVTWARKAEVCAQYLKKGSPVCVEGRLQSRSWETPDGQKRSTIEVVASNVQFLGRGQGAAPDAGEEVSARTQKAPEIPEIQIDEKDLAAPGPAETSHKTQEDEVPF